MENVTVSKNCQYVLRCGVKVVVTELMGDNVMVQVISHPPGRLTKTVIDYWPVGQRRILKRSGNGHQWGRDFDIVEGV